MDLAPQPPIQVPPANPQQIPVNPSPKKKFPLLFVLLAVTVLVITGSGAYFLINPAVKLPKDLKNSPVTPTTKPSPTLDPTSNWKTYTGKDFSFKYPLDYTVQEPQKNYINLLADPNNSQTVEVAIDARLYGIYDNFISAVATTKAGLDNINEEEKVNGIKITGVMGPGMNQGTPLTIMLFKYKHGVIAVETTTTNSAKLVIYDQILSTFKFANP